MRASQPDPAPGLRPSSAPDKILVLGPFVRVAASAKAGTVCPISLIREPRPYNVTSDVTPALNCGDSRLVNSVRNYFVKPSPLNIDVANAASGVCETYADRLSQCSGLSAASGVNGSVSDRLSLTPTPAVIPPIAEAPQVRYRVSDESPPHSPQPRGSALRLPDRPSQGSSSSKHVHFALKDREVDVAATHAALRPLRARWTVLENAPNNKLVRGTCVLDDANLNSPKEVLADPDVLGVTGVVDDASVPVRTNPPTLIDTRSESQTGGHGLERLRTLTS